MGANKLKLKFMLEIIAAFKLKLPKCNNNPN